MAGKSVLRVVISVVLISLGVVVSLLTRGSDPRAALTVGWVIVALLIVRRVVRGRGREQ